MPADAWVVYQFEVTTEHTECTEAKH